MSENAYSIQVDPALAREAQIVLRRLGMDVSSAVSLFLRDTVHNGGEFFRTRNPDVEIPNDKTIAAFEELDSGGMGISLVKSIADELSYRRNGGRNVLTMSFNLPDE